MIFLYTGLVNKSTQSKTVMVMKCGLKDSPILYFSDISYSCILNALGNRHAFGNARQLNALGNGHASGEARQ
jgi:hypothetical protein